VRDLGTSAKTPGHITEPDAVCVPANQMPMRKFPITCIQVSKRIKRRDVRAGALIRKFYVLAHGVCSGKSDRMLFSFASQTPRSVIKPVINSLGVTSKP